MSHAAVEVITDAGSCGLGHLRRSEELARRIKEAKWVSWIRVLSKDAEHLADARLIGHGEPDLTVIDLPTSGDGFVREARAIGRPTLGLDYVGELAPSLVLNLFRRGSVPPGPNQRSGLQYAIIRGEIRRAQRQHGEHVLVTLGSQDLLGQSAEAALAASSAGFPVIVVEGALSPSSGGDRTSGVECLRAPTDLPELLATCRWAITNGGTSMLEAMYLGKPTVVLPQTPDEALFAKQLSRQGGLLGLGIKAISWPGGEVADKIGARAAALVDGRGVDRVFRALSGLHRA